MKYVIVFNLVAYALTYVLVFDRRCVEHAMAQSRRQRNVYPESASGKAHGIFIHLHSFSILSVEKIAFTQTAYLRQQMVQSKIAQMQQQQKELCILSRA